ncbi:MAG: HPr(Ser) kinase/phosphatase [Acutalibacteraceae bacterium]|nr:HPr(Ser) kinase/phosphatase [Acutalibacteraceae bacterium]
MATEYTVELTRIIKEFSLETLYMPQDETIVIKNNDVNRPGLQFGGYYKYFDNSRIQIVGRAEESFIKTFEKEKYNQLVETFFASSPAAVIISRSIELEGFVEAAARHNVPLLRTAENTSEFMAALIAFLNLNLAPRITRHGVLVEVYGEGILILGESGVGKSETAIELVKRGHRLIADDAVEIRRVSNKSLVGAAPNNIRHFIELRGIGIINVSRIFGAGAVKLTEKIDYVINIEPWDNDKVYDRMGLEEQTTEILGLTIPSITIPVKPGRNLAVIIEVAAMNNRQKKLGYNAAADLLSRLGMGDAATEQKYTEEDVFN